ncbi:hypothetical protein OKA05_13385 [Luteolibacter arcticus]|uniref:Membrane protein YfhO n=1 Tax=Luteolibacter arcticus TaxID=1581411 RepID=A0ABT3GJ91_9BACT|nr:hypothetical protein [Luteolibacter arcticus]MCW1923551.1 hypothetical protein [Luteolibacter arcticus]
MSEEPSEKAFPATPSVRRRQTFVCACICAAAILAWFSPWWMGGRVLAPLDVMHELLQPWRGTDAQVSVKNHFVVDAIDNYLTYRILAADSYRAEGWVGWSSLTYGGTVQYANTMALYYDWTMQLHRWFDFWTAWHLGIMGQFLLASLGMLLFLRGRGIGPLWSCCGALAYAANTQFIIWVYHRWALSAFCWVPWILWAADCYKRGRKPAWALVPAFIAMAFLGGSLQHCAFVALVVSALWAEEALKAGKSLVAQARLLGRYSAWGVLAAGMAAMMLLPCIAAYHESSQLGLHSTARMGLYPHGMLQPVMNLLAYALQVFPSVVGRPCTMDALKVFKSELFFVAYFGSLPVLIAFLACFRKNVPPLARFLILIGLLIPLTPLVKYLYQRMLLIWILGGIFAFVDFMQRSSPTTRLRIAKVTGICAGAAVILWTLGSLVLAMKREQVTALLQAKFLGPGSGGAFGIFKSWMQGRLEGFVNDCLIWSPQQLIPLALFFASLAGLALTASVVSRRRMIGSGIVAVAGLAELMVFSSRWVTWSDLAKHPLFPVTPEAAALQQHVKNGRIFTSIKSLETHMAETPFLPNTLTAYGVATISGFDSIAKDGMVSPARLSGDARSLGRIGVSHLVTCPGNAPREAAWEKVWSSEVMEIYQNRDAVPRYVGFQDDSSKDSFLRNEGSSHWETLQESSGRENARKIEVPPGIRWIRIAENQADGWKYRTADSAPDAWRPVLRAPDASMVLPLENPPPGQPTTVLMEYDPPLRKAGFVVSTVALLLTILSAWGVSRLKPRAPAEARGTA